MNFESEFRNPRNKIFENCFDLWLQFLRNEFSWHYAIPDVNLQHFCNTSMKNAHSPYREDVPTIEKVNKTEPTISYQFRHSELLPKKKTNFEFQCRFIRRSAWRCFHCESSHNCWRLRFSCNFQTTTATVKRNKGHACQAFSAIKINIKINTHHQQEHRKSQQTGGFATATKLSTVFWQLTTQDGFYYARTPWICRNCHMQKNFHSTSLLEVSKQW